jgi:hydrogenase/urease accessory protein HupE
MRQGESLTLPCSTALSRMIARFHILLLGLFGSPGMVLAHGPISESDYFYHSLLHPLFVPSHLLLLIAFGLLLGQQGARRNLPALAIFSISLIAGLAYISFSKGVEVDAFLLPATVVIGLVVAAAQAVGLYLCAIVAAFVGFFIGLDSLQETIAVTEKLVPLLGSGIGMMLIVLYAMMFADYFSNRAWQKIGLRIIGSWIAASAIMVLALNFRVNANL